MFLLAVWLTYRKHTVKGDTQDTGQKRSFIGMLPYDSLQSEERRRDESRLTPLNLIKGLGLSFV